MTITSINLERFTAFEKLDFNPSPGINVLVGANGTGKTHLMKVAYAACDVSKSGKGFADKLMRVFMPSKQQIGRLVNRGGDSSECAVKVERKEVKDLCKEIYLKASFSRSDETADSVRISNGQSWTSVPVESVYVPVKEMLANAPGFRSLYSQREVYFEEIYDDIVARAYLPSLRDLCDQSKGLLDTLQTNISGEVHIKNEEFFLQNSEGNLEFSLLAEGLRKLGLLWLLIQNGTLSQGSVLFWDEPETNLNPKLFEPVINILLQLQRMNVQIFVATHDYAFLKELDLQRKDSDRLCFHSLYHSESSSSGIACKSVKDYLEIDPNAIAETFIGLYDRELKRSLERFRQ